MTAAELQTSKFPDVRDIPIELQPFTKKARLISIVQRRNEKAFYNQHNRVQKRDQENARHRLKSEFQQKLRDEKAGNSGYAAWQPNAISDVKVKMWSHMLNQSKRRMSPLRGDDERQLSPDIRMA